MNNLVEAVKPYFSESSVKGSHGYDHALRVHNIGKYIAEREGGDLYVVRAGCLLHDIGKDHEREGMCHAEFGAQMSDEILRAIGFPKDKIEGVVYCVRVHRYSKGISPVTIEER